MKNKEKFCSIALASTFIIFFLVLISSIASASSGGDLHKAPPDLTSGTGDLSNDKDLSYELSKERDGIATAAPIIVETQITKNTEHQLSPAIYGNRIVWRDGRNEDWEIYMYDISTSKETRITSNHSDKSSPAIYDNRIVWQDDRNGNWDIYMYDISTSAETQITINELDQWNPAIYGNRIVWEDYRNGKYNPDIYMYDLSTSTETQITTNGTARYPDIYGNRIVWEDLHCIICMYDISTSTEKQIATSGIAFKPAIYEDRIVWHDERDSRPYDIYMYDLSTSKETQITTGGSVFEPAIYGNRIVWTDYHLNGNMDVYVYDLTTGQKSHTTNEFDQRQPDIYGDRIVWEDSRSGNEDIYMGTLITTPPVAAFSASPTSGKAPLNVTFKDKSTNYPTSWKWNFGDGTNSTQQNPIHRYRAEGNYTVKLTATNDFGSNTSTRGSYIKVITNTRPGIYSKN